MKKGVAITAGVVIVGAGLWLGGTWYTGQRIEAEAPQRLTEANEELAKALPGYNVKIEQLSFARSFFGSDARYAVSLASPPELKEDFPNGLRFEFDTHFQHGPFPGKALASGHFAPSLAFVHSELVKTPDVEAWFKAAGDKTPFWADTIVGYRRNGKMHAEFLPLNFAKDDTKLSFGGATFKGDYTDSNKGTKGVLSVPSVKVEGRDAKSPTGGMTTVQADDLAISVDLRQGNFGMQTGNSEIKIKNIAVDSEEVKFTVTNTSYGAETTEDEKFVKGSIWYRTEALKANGKDMGSQDLTIKVDRVDGKVLANVTKLYNEIVAQQMRDGVPPEELSQAQIQQIAEVALPMLDANPSIAIEPLKLKNDKGESSLSAKLTLARPAGTQVPPLMLAQQAIKSLDASLSLNRPMAIQLGTQVMELQGMSPEMAAAQAKQQIEQMFGMAVMMNAGKVEGETLTSTFAYGDGKVNLNGREMPASSLLGGLMAQ